ncbi:unnamed protein product [Albugo candida]|uniref:NADH dehydrogenase [ubiquinone] 1 beta subcomplex subunit 3 n=1 Tax=Albugo candida TaxID=65357 RepID=A0A024G595_9STRA|nr:unnamed protein product [Albugo candida]|eukprot:CCI41738.1 unnamed protein product [Albugo candida]
MVLAHQDAWRKHPFISNCKKKPLPGFGIASAIFGVYLVIDFITKDDPHKHLEHHKTSEH